MHPAATVGRDLELQPCYPTTMSRVGLGLVILVAVTSCSTTPSDPSTSPSPDISSEALPVLPDTVAATEPTIAVARDGTVGVAWLDYNGATLLPTVTFSSDRGTSWATPERLTLPDGRDAGDEIIAADQSGYFFLATLGLADSPAGTTSKVLVARAQPGSTKFGPFVEASDSLVSVNRDASALTVAKDGSLNVVWSEYDATNYTSIVTARSTNRATNWSRIVLKGPGSSSAWPNICASRTSAELAIVTYDAKTRSTEVRWSEDSGATWPSANVNRVALPANANVGEFPSCVVDGKDLWIFQGVAQDKPSATLAPVLFDVQSAHSSDGGRTFEPVTSVVDAAAGPGYMRAMATLRSNGTMALAYYAGSKANDPAATVRLSRSSNLGTFGASEVLFAPMILSTSRIDADWLGNLLGITSDARNVFAVYVDNSSGAARVRFTRTKP